jgi:hypothetical protein
MQRYNLVSVPKPSNGLVPELLKARDLILEGIGFSQWKELCEKCIGAFIPSRHNLLVGIELLLCLPQ